ncbi:FAD-dependent monooxygenase (plasmid) [Streptomyces sp. NBC_01591]|uniref:FAD-dependent monooxygenase n=1 Tax=Streptomyces sp. NBC_01591 TaxID=2975888 RepID=UPI002DDC7F5B|nr:FAD-dependent monooxygenase [Streptomyces sp. NBC_01591]WSD73854.1 FAD-dependent monooxygenase [Streptomyces sp. NBC_01591]
MQGERSVRAQVVVVGGGPVGMLVAAELAGYGVDTVLLECRADVSEQPKATTLHARAVQTLARRGHLPGQGYPYTDGAADSTFHFAGLPGLVITAPAREPEPILKCPQAELERHFEERGRAAGVRILREHRVTEVVQEDGGVRVTADGPQGTAVCFAEYVVGADGARSTVRDQAGIASDTHPATVSALMGTVTLAQPDALTKGWHRTPRGWIVAKRDAEGRTHIRTLNCTGAHADRQLPPTLEELHQEVSWIAGRDIAMDEPRWLSRFSDFARLARTYRAGRIFLVGDAAHVHFPIGGQGLSTGVLDALNLGWKLALALAVHGSADAGLLDTYDVERRPVARQVIDHTQAQLALMRPGPELDALRRVFTGILSADREHGHLGDLISAQDTVLPDHTDVSCRATGTFLRNAVLSTADGETDVIGLLHEGRPLLLLFGEGDSGHREAAREWEGILNVVRARPTAEVPHDALLVRPDGYIAWAPGGRDLTEVLSAYFVKGVVPKGVVPAGHP